MHSSKQPVVISDNVINSIYAVWQQIGHDCESACQEMGETLTNWEAIETCIDADRLPTMCGAKGKEADLEVDELIRTHGYDALMGALQQKMRLA